MIHEIFLNVIIGGKKSILYLVFMFLAWAL